MRNYIPSISGLRAVSIFIVILFHMNVSGSFGHMISIPFPFTFLFDGNFGVNVFFVISGFLITSLLIEEENKTGTISLRRFYIRRIFRIFPAYYFLLFVYAILQLFSVFHLTIQSWLSSIFYYKYMVPGDKETAHLWSLSVEEHFYLVWPAIFLIFRKSRVYFAFAIISLVFACRLLAYHYNSPEWIISNWSFIFQRVDGIMIGCLVAMFRSPLDEWMGRLLKLRWLPFLLILLFINTHYFVDINTLYKLHLGFILIPLGIGSTIGTLTNVFIAFVLLFSMNYKGNGWFQFLNSAWMNYIGKLSYSLYLWQQLFIMSDTLGYLNKFPLNIICTALAALLSYYIIELPFLKVKSKFEYWKIQNVYARV